MWINDPTPVMSSTKTIESWSISVPNSTWKSATGTQVKMLSVNARSSPGCPSIEKSIAAPSTNEATGAATPSRCPQLFDRRPARSRIPADTSGMATSSQACVKMPVAACTSPIASTRQYLSRFASSTDAVLRVRKMVMMMASPMTTSAAATTITKNAMI